MPASCSRRRLPAAGTLAWIGRSHRGLGAWRRHRTTHPLDIAGFSATANSGPDFVERSWHRSWSWSADVDSLYFRAARSGSKRVAIAGDSAIVRAPGRPLARSMDLGFVCGARECDPSLFIAL